MQYLPPAYTPNMNTYNNNVDAKYLNQDFNEKTRNIGCTGCSLLLVIQKYERHFLKT